MMWPCCGYCGFFKYVEQNVNEYGCWRWTGATSGNEDRGQFRSKPAYRWAYEQYVGPVPEGLVLDHFLYPWDGCIGPACVNPEHVTPRTQKQNMSPTRRRPNNWGARPVYVTPAELEAELRNEGPYWDNRPVGHDEIGFDPNVDAVYWCRRCGKGWLDGMKGCPDCMSAG